MAEAVAPEQIWTGVPNKLVSRESGYLGKTYLLRSLELLGWLSSQFLTIPYVPMDSRRTLTRAIHPLTHIQN